MSALHPLALVLLPPLAALALLAHRRREARSARLRAALRAGPAPGLARMQAAATLVAALALGASLAAPRLGGASGPKEGSGATVVLVVDASASMTVRDVAPDRMTQARMAALRLASESGARVGLVAFSNHAGVLLPPTDDTGLVSLYLEAFASDVTSGQGSSLLAGVERAVTLVGGDTARARHVVVVSDGETPDDEGQAARLARRAAALGVEIHGLLVGSPAGGVVPGVPGSHSAADPRLLARLAQGTGGSSGAADGPGVTGLVQRLRRAATDARPEKATSGMVDLTPLLALLALAALLVERGVDGVRRRLAW